MPDADFAAFRELLLRRGVSPAGAIRMSGEIEDHYLELVADGQEAGLSRMEAEQQAIRSLGQLDEIAAMADNSPSLKGWAWRWPRIALIVYPLACVLALPAVPLMAGVQHAPQLLRWATCLFAGACITALMFLVLQLSITLA